MAVERGPVDSERPPTERQPSERPPTERVRIEGLRSGEAWLMAAGLAYLGLGVVLAIAFVAGGVQSSLFPTGWIFPAVLMATGALMSARRRFDIVAALWGGLALAVFLLDVLVYMNALDRGLEDPGAFDASVVVAAFGLLALILRPGFRR